MKRMAALLAVMGAMSGVVPAGALAATPASNSNPLCDGGGLVGLLLRVC